MDENRRIRYRISELFRELGISMEWLRKGEVDTRETVCKKITPSNGGRRRA